MIWEGLQVISVNDFSRGVAIEYEGSVWQVVEFMHVKPGKGAAFVRSKLKNVRTGAVVETTFRGGEKVPHAHLERSEYQFLYLSDSMYTFMNNETYEQFSLGEAQMGDSKWFLKENMTVVLMTWQGNVIGVELPNTVELEVVETEPGLRGDTAQGGSKPAKLETGYSVTVPLFVNQGDRLRVDTRTGQYLSRA